MSDSETKIAKSSIDARVSNPFISGIKDYFSRTALAAMAAFTMGLPGCGDGPIEPPEDVIVNISGNYVDLAGNPIAGAAVGLTNGSLERPTTTNAQGGFSFGVKNPTTTSGSLTFTKDNTTPKQMGVSVSGTQDLGNIQGNIGVEVLSNPPQQEILEGEQLELPLEQYVANDEPSVFTPRDASFLMRGDTILYDGVAAGTFGTWVDVADRTDPGLPRDSLYVDVSVTAPPDIIGPVINLPDTLYFNEGESLTLGLDSLATDNVTASGSLAWAFRNQDDVTTSIDSREVTLSTTDADYNGEDVITADVTDEANNTSSKDVVVVVAPINDAPVFSGPVPDGVTVQDSIYTINAAGFFSDVDDATLSYIVNNLGVNASQSEVGGIVTITPDAGWNGTLAGLVLQAEDAATATAESNVFSVNVQAPGNQPPVEDVVIVNQAVAEDNTLALIMSNYVSDPDADALSYSISTLPNATYTVSGDTVRITPDADYNGPINNIIINVSDGTANINLTSFNLAVNAVNDSPSEIATIGAQSVDEDNPLVLDMTNHVVDVDMDVLAYTIASLPNASYSVSGNTLTITPDADYNGPINYCCKRQ